MATARLAAPASSQPSSSNPPHASAATPATPLPTWKLSHNPFHRQDASARRLAASLWASIRRRQPASQHAASRSSQASQCSGSLQASMQHTDVSREPNMTVREGETRKKMQDPRDFIPADDSTVESTVTYGSPIEMDEVKHAIASGEEFKLGVADSQSSPEESSELLIHLRSLEDQQGASFSLTAALRSELEHAHARVQELECAQNSACREIGHMLRIVEEGRTVAHSKEQERAIALVCSLREEIDVQKRARRNLETVNRRLIRDISSANKALAKAVSEMKQERRARELMEDVCDELAKEIGRDKAEAEQLKKEHAKARVELDAERKMLQKAEVWQEERVQMKLAEARIEFEEKSMILNKLKNDLEVFLEAHRSSDCKIDDLAGETENQNVADLLHEARAATSWNLEVDLEGSTKVRGQDNDSADGMADLNYQDELEEISVLDRIPHSHCLKQSQNECQMPIRICQSTENYLDRLGEIRLDQGNYGHNGNCTQDGNETGGGSESENRAGEADTSDWNADCDEDYDKMEESSPWNSVTDTEGDDTDGCSSDFSEVSCFRRRENQGRGESYSRSIQGMSTMAPIEEVGFPIYNGSLKDPRNGRIRAAADAFSSLLRDKCAAKLAEAPMSHTRQGSQKDSDCHAPNSVKGLAEWPGSYKSSSSLQARLVEARMERGKSHSKHLLGFRKKHLDG